MPRSSCFRRPCRSAPSAARALAAAVLILAAAGVLACGYRFQGAGKLPAGIARIFVETFENRTTETALESLVTSAVVFEFTKRNKEAVAPSAEEADAVLKGVIRSISLQTVSTRGKDAAGERRVTLHTDLRLIGKDGRVLWAAKDVAEYETYSVSDDKFSNERKQRAALAMAASRIAEKIYNRFTDDF
jgi:outer membrane lipopolysaccharide assembly protein LptE/RlpB